jgi:hypothetical protein
MKLILTILALLLSASTAAAQKLPGNTTCQDMVDSADGKMSRTNDGGKTYVPISVPRPTSPEGYAIMTHMTLQCRRLLKGEISVSEFDALNAEKYRQVHNDHQKVLAEQRRLENQERTLQTQREAVQVQRQTTVIQALQTEAARQQQAAQHQDRMEQQRYQQQVQEQQQQIQQRQLDAIRLEQARPRSFSCFGSGNYIQCN